MKKDLLVLLSLGLITCLVYFKSFSVFFAQDDFILINQFSQNSILTDLVNVFGPPKVTHWRPVHNLYFFITGNIFGRNYFGYHLVTFFLHIISAFFVYKICLKILYKKSFSFFCSLIYTIGPVHFVSLFWISGGATLIGFLFFILSFYVFLEKKYVLALFLYTLSILASEAMIMTLAIFFGWSLIEKRRLPKFSFVFFIISITLIFLLARFLISSSNSVPSVYQIQFSPANFYAVRFYLLRILGFGEGLGLNLINLTNLLLIFALGYLLIKRLFKKNDNDNLLFGLFIILVGLFPFVLLPEHLSAHYMNISTFGMSLVAANLLNRTNRSLLLLITLLILFGNIYKVNYLEENHWVTKRAKLAKAYIETLEHRNFEAKSKIIFGDNELSDSKEAFVSLGAGEAIDFWFKDKDYKSCFTFREICLNLP